MRTATPAFTTEVGKKIGAIPLQFLYADFGITSGILALWNGLGRKTWNSQEYLSGIGLIKADGGAENADGTTEPMSFSLAWKDNDTMKDFVQAALTAKSGRKAFLAQGFMDVHGQVITDPIYVWYGRVGIPTIQENPKAGDGSISISVSCTAEEYRTDKDRQLKFRITPASQLQFDKTDTGLRYQSTLATQDLQWGLFYYKEQHSP